MDAVGTNYPVFHFVEQANHQIMVFIQPPGLLPQGLTRCKHSGIRRLGLFFRFVQTRRVCRFIRIKPETIPCACRCPPGGNGPQCSFKNAHKTPYRNLASLYEPPRLLAARQRRSQ